MGDDLRQVAVRAGCAAILSVRNCYSIDKDKRGSVETQVDPDAVARFIDAVLACARDEGPGKNPVYNIGTIEVTQVGHLIGGGLWVQLRCLHAGEGSPLIVQLPKQEWERIVKAEAKRLGNT